MMLLIAYTVGSSLLLYTRYHPPILCTVLNMTEVASNAQLLRWPLNQEYLNPPL